MGTQFYWMVLLVSSTEDILFMYLATEPNFCLFYLLSFVSGGQSSPSLRGTSLHLGKFLHRLVLG